MSVTHPKVSTVSDDLDPTAVQPSDWNDDHTVTGFTCPILTAGTAPIAFSRGESTFNGTQDPRLSFGYNLTYGGTLITAGVPAFAYMLEGDYNNGIIHQCEAYLSWFSADGLTEVRPFMVAVNRDTGAYVGSQLAGPLTMLGAGIILPAASSLGWTGISAITSNATGTFLFTNSAGGGTQIKIAFGSTGTQPMLRNVGAQLQVVDISESGYAAFRCGAATVTPGAFAGGDKYLVVDASGNVHVSALGPAS